METASVNIFQLEICDLQLQGNFILLMTSDVNGEYGL